MEWLEKLMNDGICPECGQVILFGSGTDRDIQDDFSVMCLEIGKSQRDVLEGILTHVIQRYNNNRE